MCKGPTSSQVSSHSLTGGNAYSYTRSASLAYLSPEANLPHECTASPGANQSKAGKYSACVQQRCSALLVLQKQGIKISIITRFYARQL